MDLSMSGIYNAQISLETEERLRNVIGMSVAAAMKLKDYGYEDEAIYEIIQVLFGAEVKADQRKIDQIEEILECVHGLADTEEDFAQKVRDILSGKG